MFCQVRINLSSRILAFTRTRLFLVCAQDVPPWFRTAWFCSRCSCHNVADNTTREVYGRRYGPERSRETHLHDEAPRDVQVLGVAPRRVRDYEHQANSGSCEGISQGVQGGWCKSASFFSFSFRCGSFFSFRSGLVSFRCGRFFQLQERPRQRQFLQLQEWPRQRQPRKFLWDTA